MIMKKRFALVVAVLLTPVCKKVAADDMRLWPAQKAPTGIVTLSAKACTPPGEVKSCQNENLILAQSLVGLTAQAVNEGRFDEMVYLLEEGNGHYGLWLKLLLKRTGIEDRGREDLWPLIRRYKGRGVFNGYILYRVDTSPGDSHTVRQGSDESVNVATAAAGILQGLLVSEALQPVAEMAGLKMLFDARGKPEEWAFNHFQDQLGRTGVLLQDPRLWFGRAAAIANRFFCMYGLDTPADAVYDWMHKPGLVFGWNDGRHEGKSVLQLCERGHVISASDWAINLSAHAIGSSSFRPQPFQSVDTPAEEPTQKRPAVSFCISDGDNLQWMLRDFALNTNYWAAPDHGKFPIGWGIPVADLLETGLDTYTYLQRTVPATSGIFMMTEYFFPDRYAIRLGDEQRRALLVRLGKRAERAMNISNVKILGFLVMDLDSPLTRNGLEAMASSMPSLEGILAWAYHPYEAGGGKVLWIQGAKGPIPVITCTYSIWANRNGAASGTPAKIARLLNERARTAEEPFTCWSIIHAWSGFKEHIGLDEQAEHAVFLTPGTAAGVAPAKWCIDRLDTSIEVITPETLVKRIKAEVR